MHGNTNKATIVLGPLFPFLFAHATLRRRLHTRLGRLDAVLRGKDLDPKVLVTHKLEVLPACPGCGRTHTWVPGAKDFTHLIYANAKERKRLQRCVS